MTRREKLLAELLAWVEVFDDAALERVVVLTHEHCWRCGSKCRRRKPWSRHGRPFVRLECRHCGTKRLAIDLRPPVRKVADASTGLDPPPRPGAG
jgi:hypothetical protein